MINDIELNMKLQLFLDKTKPGSKLIKVKRMVRSNDFMPIAGLTYEVEDVVYTTEVPMGDVNDVVGDELNERYRKIGQKMIDELVPGSEVERAFLGMDMGTFQPNITIVFRRKGTVFKETYGLELRHVDGTES